MIQVSVHEAKTHLSRLLRQLATGEEIVINRSGKPVARLVPFAPPRERELGRDLGLFEVPEDFDEALPSAVVDSFER